MHRRRKADKKSCVTLACTSNELHVRNKWEENTQRKTDMIVETKALQGTRIRTGTERGRGPERRESSGTYDVIVEVEGITQERGRHHRVNTTRVAIRGKKQEL